MSVVDASPATEAPTEEAPAAEEPTEVDASAEAPVEGEPVEGEKPAEEKPGAAEIPEEVLQKAAIKFANRTMAAARRAESAVAAVKTENESLKQQNSAYTNFVAELKANPFAAIKKLGFKSVRDFVDHGIQAGDEPAAETVEQKIERLEQERRDERAATALERQTAETEASKASVFAAIDKLQERYDFATTDIGHDAIWEAIVAYHGKHGTVPDAAVFHIADNVEKALEQKFSNVRKFKTAQSQGATKPGSPAAATAGTAARSSGKTLTNGSTSGAPTSREYSMDPEERRAQVVADMRASGEL